MTNHLVADINPILETLQFRQLTSSNKIFVTADKLKPKTDIGRVAQICRCKCGTRKNRHGTVAHEEGMNVLRIDRTPLEGAEDVKRQS